MRCSVCGSGYRVGKHDAVISFKDSLKVSCGLLERTQVHDEFLSKQDCLLVSAQIFQKCGCFIQHRNMLRRKQSLPLLSRGSEGTSLLAKNPSRNTYHTGIFMVPDNFTFSSPQGLSQSRTLQEFHAESIFIPIFVLWAVICLCTACLNCKRNLDNRPAEVLGPGNDGRIRESMTRTRPPGTGVVVRPSPPPLHIPHVQIQDQSNAVNGEKRRRVLQKLFPEHDNQVRFTKISIEFKIDIPHLFYFFHEQEGATRRTAKSKST
jgi:hypothetical protein